MRVMLLIMLLFLATSVSVAQDIGSDNLEWSVTSFTDIQNGMVIEEQSFLITRLNRMIEWRAWDGSTKQVYKIIDVLGSWNNVNEQGTVTYQVTNDKEEEATITIERIDNHSKARIMKLIEGDPIVYELELGSVVKL